MPQQGKRQQAHAVHCIISDLTRMASKHMMIGQVKFGQYFLYDLIQQGISFSRTHHFPVMQKKMYDPGVILGIQYLVTAPGVRLL